MATKSFNQTLAVNGTFNGVLTVSDSSGFEVGATVFLAAKDERIQQLKVGSKPSSTSVVVVTLADATFDASAFTVAKEAKLFQPRSGLLVPSNPPAKPFYSGTLTQTTTIAVPNGSPELVLNGDTGNVLVIKKNNVEKASIDVDGLITAAGIKFPDNTTQTTASVGGGGGGGGWTVAREINFTALSNQTLATTTTYNLGGVVWNYRAINTRENTALINGTGIVFKPTELADWFPPNGSGWVNNAPELWIRLVDLIPNWNPQMPVRFSVNFEVTGATVNFQEFMIGVELRLNDGSDSTSRTYYTHLITCGWTTILGINPRFWMGSNLSYSSDKRLPLAGKNVVGMDFPNGFLGGPAKKFAGTYTTGWPTGSNVDAISYDEYANAGTSNLGYHSKNNYYLFFVAKAGPTAGTPVYTLKRLKIETQES